MLAHAHAEILNAFLLPTGRVFTAYAVDLRVNHNTLTSLSFDGYFGQATGAVSSLTFGSIFESAPPIDYGERINPGSIPVLG
jgi:hypothetical protein